MYKKNKAFLDKEGSIHRIPKIIAMKLGVLLMCAGSLQASTMTFGQSITLHKKDAKLVRVLRQVQQQSGYNVFYDATLISPSLTLDVSMTNKPLKQALDLILSSYPLEYSIVDKTIILSRSTDSGNITNNPPSSKIENLQQRQIRGVVTGSDGLPLPGVSITEKNTSNSTMSDEQGAFQLILNGNEASVVFTSVAYQTQQVQTKSGANLSIAMVPVLNEMSEVVVVGYGTQRRSDLTGSVSSIKADRLAMAPMGQVGNSLQGLTTGLEIVANGGSPAAEPSIQIRGTGSINSSNPLLVVDGVPTGNLSDLNPNDIAQVEVLKDASSAAIYGTRAANGVILVTTKRGRFGQPTKYNVNLYSGITHVNNKLDLLSAADLVTLKKERYANDQIAVNPFWDNNYYQTSRADWQDELFQQGRLENVDVSMTSGSDRSSYLTSLGYYNETGIMTSSKFRRFSARFNSNHKISDKLSLTQNLQYSYKNWFDPSTSSVYSGVLWQALRFNPAIPVQNELGEWGTASANNELGDINNPVYELATEDRIKSNHNMLASLTLKYNINSDFSLNGNVGFDGNIYQSRDFFPSVTKQMRRRNDAELIVTDERRYSLLGEAFLNYQKNIGVHRLDAVLGTSYQAKRGDYQTVSKRSFADESLEQIVFDNGATMNTITGNFDVPEKIASVFGRLNYSFANKYLLTATMRSDGSSKFASGNRWGYFPGISLGWRLSEERFLNDLDFIQDLKIKGGWGMLGNQEVSDLQYLTIIKRNIDYGNKYTFGSNKVGGARITSLANPFITWEKTAMTNIGIDAELWDGALKAGVTWFDKRTTDMLIPAVVMGTIGRATIPDSNIGEMRNWGWEVELDHTGSRGSNFQYQIGLNLTLLKNEVTKLYGNNNYISSVFYGRQSQEISRTYEGMPLASFYGWKTNGIYQNRNQIEGDAYLANDSRKDDIKPGDVRFVDINGDGKVDELDRTYLGDPNPSAIVGLQLAARYKNFSLAANLTGNFGGELFNADRMQGLDPTYSYNMYAEAMDRWTGEGTSNKVPRMSTQRANLNHRTSDLFVERGDFVKLKTITLAYHLQPNKRFLTNMTVYVMAENLLTITGYSGYNPEIGYSDGNLQRGVDYANYPFSRKINLGFKFDF